MSKKKEKTEKAKKMKEKKYIMYIDETGVSSFQSTSPFTVTGVIFEHKYSFNDTPSNPSILKQKINKFKNDCFDKDDFFFHLTDITYIKEPFRKEDGVTIPQLKNFWSTLPKFLEELECTIISVTVNKEKLLKYYNSPKDPYAIAFAHIMKSFYSFLLKGDSEKIKTTARIVIESRDDNQNLKVQKAFFDIFNSGTIHIEFNEIKDKLKGFIFAPKDSPQYHSGLEIVDLVCNPLSRARQGLVEARPDYVDYGDENKIFTSVRSKIYVNETDQDIRNWGFKYVPIFKRKRDWIINTSLRE